MPLHTIPGLNPMLFTLYQEFRKAIRSQGKTGTVLLRLWSKLTGQIPLCIHVIRSKTVPVLPWNLAVTEKHENDDLGISEQHWA